MIRAPINAARVARAVERWFSANARAFPWRPLPLGTARDPWRSLVSELMLQQTQASRVAERFEGFMDLFPTPVAMGAAEVDDVVAAWSGMGYYRRARMLHAAAQAIVTEHGGRVPHEVGALRRLPGVGRYTAGAVASMVYGLREPLVDGNVVRVLLRLAGRDGHATDRETVAWVWAEAERLVEASGSPGVLNEGLMQLGAEVCTPRRARCDECPLGAVCVARRDGRVSEIPRPKPRPRVETLWAAAVVNLDRRGRVLVERRPDGGLFGGMWQVPTLERSDSEPGAKTVLEYANAEEVEWAYGFVHKTTHREIRFDVWSARRMRAGRGRVRVDVPGLGGLALASPQRRIIDRALASAPG